jgi:PKHD-type hydroxylase
MLFNCIYIPLDYIKKGNMQYHWWLKESILEPYIYGEKIFNNEEIEKIIKIGKDEKFSTFEEPFIGDEKGDKVKDISNRNCFLSFIRSDLTNNEWIFRRITDVITNINRDFYNYDIEYIENLQFTEYQSPGHFYGKHVDLQYKSSKTRKISFSIQLTEDTEYEGGDLILYTGKETKTKRNKGFINVFPSYMLHEVTPVNKGTRCSLVGWILGPNFK